MPFSKPLYFDNILHKKAGPSRKTITKHIADTCNETNKSLLDVIDENKILDERNFDLLRPHRIAEIKSTFLKKLTRGDNDSFACSLSRPSSTVFSESSVKPFIVSYHGRLYTGSCLSSLDTKHEVTPHNPSYFSPHAYLETIVLPSDDATAEMLSTLTSRSTTTDLSTFGKLYATPISERIHLPFEYTDSTCSYDRPTLCSCLIAEAVVLIHKKKPSPSIQVFRIKNNVISYRYTFDIPQKETPHAPSPTRDEMSEIVTQYERFVTKMSQGIGITLNQAETVSTLTQDAGSILNPDVCYFNTSDSSN